MLRESVRTFAVTMFIWPEKHRTMASPPSASPFGIRAPALSSPGPRSATRIRQSTRQTAWLWPRTLWIGFASPTGFNVLPEMPGCGASDYILRDKHHLFDPFVFSVREL